MNKADLIDRIAAGCGISKAQAATAIDPRVVGDPAVSVQAVSGRAVVPLAPASHLEARRCSRDAPPVEMVSSVRGDLAQIARPLIGRPRHAAADRLASRRACPPAGSWKGR